MHIHYCTSTTPPILFLLLYFLIIIQAKRGGNNLKKQKEFPALHLEFESCIFSTQQYKVEKNQIIKLKWLIPVDIFEGLDIDFHVFVTDVFEETTYDHQQIKPIVSKHLFKNVLVGHLHFVAVSISIRMIFLLSLIKSLTVICLPNYSLGKIPW